MSKAKIVGGAVGAAAIALGLIYDHEGWRLVAYADPVGIPTICAGVTKGVKLGDTATEEECSARTIEALNEAIATVHRCAPGVTFKDHQLAAWASFTYNVGPGRTGPNGKDGFCVLKSGKQPTHLKRLLAGDHDGACQMLSQWLKAGPFRFPGLVKRRAAERAMCLGATVE